MSRTYRRKNVNHKKWYYGDVDTDDFYEYEIGQTINLSDYTKVTYSGWCIGSFRGVRYTGHLDRNSKKYKKNIAYFHSDAGTPTCKEPGPGWWRKLTVERPNRRFVKSEIKKYMLLDGNYEIIIETKPPLPWWN